MVRGTSIPIYEKRLNAYFQCQAEELRFHHRSCHESDTIPIVFPAIPSNLISDCYDLVVRHSLFFRRFGFHVCPTGRVVRYGRNGSETI